ncbi:Zn-ribbon domain-containing OB-fold protein [Halobium palmae]|uniref:Zn-ribbon domain-containing OB-fold protein n=1 Tax=Halobium palmae TaxID=1776492 RepID=A0ABD5S528_9EURY
MTDDHSDTDESPDANTNANASADSTDEPDRVQVTVPDTVEFPRLLDFYERQTEETTEIVEFYDRLREGSLSTTECDDCGAVHYPPRIVCPECTSDDLSYVSLPHEGELHAFTEVRGTAPIGMTDDVPFAVGVVDLDGVDVRLSARIEGASYEDLAIGDRVELVLVDIEGPKEQDRVFYRFAPV